MANNFQLITPNPVQVRLQHLQSQTKKDNKLTREFTPQYLTVLLILQKKKHVVPSVLAPDPYGIALCMIY